MAARDQLLAEARTAMAEHRWADAQEGFVAARALGPLGPDDMAALGDAAWWRGAIDECLEAMEEAYRLYLAADEPAERTAGRLAMEIGYFWFLRGEEAIGSGWFARAQRLLGAHPDSAEYGYLLSVGIDEAIAAGELETAVVLAREVLELSQRHGDETLGAMALVGEGIATVKQGDVASGMAILDEAMLPVVAGRVQAAYAGNIYCQLMQVCHELADVRRAGQWTDATERWCEGFESAVMFVGICRVHRAQLLQRRGEWARAEDEARQVCRDLAAMNVATVAEGYYQLAEVHRLRGELDAASEAYHEAHRRGRDPQPGMALLHLGEGRVDAAVAGIATAIDLASDRLVRASLCAAQVEIATAAGDLPTARRAADELSDAAQHYGSSGLLAEAAHARGTVSLAADQASGAISELRSAVQRWQDLRAPHRAAQARVLLARSYLAAGDRATSALELEAAATCFEELGARVDLDRVAGLQGPQALPGGLTEREVDVLRVVAGGRTNKEVADDLFLSEKTVARHLHNIYTKLGVSSRTAAAAYAFQHGLASPPPT